MLGEREDGQASGQQPEKQLLAARPAPGKRLSSIPAAKRHRSQGRAAGGGCADPPPATAPQLCASLGRGAPRYAGPCSAGDVLATFLGGREEGGWDENKAPREQRPARSGPA